MKSAFSPCQFEIVGRHAPTAPAFGIGSIYETAREAQQTARALAPQFSGVLLQVRSILSLKA
ncbi:hypothetical protein ACJ4V0_15720 [Phreatobacter sp. HK31-P]